jgi:hypothetical protein
MEQVAKLLQDKAFLTKLSDTKTQEEALAVFKANGADLTLSQLKVLRAQIVQKGGGELSPDDLELVAGGAADASQLEGLTIITATIATMCEMPAGLGFTGVSGDKDPYNYVASWGW